MSFPAAERDIAFLGERMPSQRLSWRDNVVLISLDGQERLR
jgi:hypothetical protein